MVSVSAFTSIVAGRQVRVLVAAALDDLAGDADAELARAARRPDACASALVSGSKTTWVRPPRSRRSMNTQPP